MTELVLTPALRFASRRDQHMTMVPTTRRGRHWEGDVGSGVKSILAAVVFWGLMATTVHAAPPTLARSEPANGERGVSTEIGVLLFWFDQNMKKNSWTFWQSGKGQFPPAEKDNNAQWRDSRCIELQVGKLKPATTYAVQLNSTKAQGFRSAQGNEPLPQTVITFTTAEVNQAQREDSRTSALAAPNLTSQSPLGSLANAGLESSVVGSWFMHNEGVEILVEFSADGRLRRSSQSALQTQTTSGSWLMRGKTMEVHFEGDDEALLFTLKMPDANTLELWESSDSWLRLLRREGKTSAPVSTPLTNHANRATPDHATVRIPSRDPRAIETERPQCPQGWTDFKHPLIGMQACVPKDYWVRLRGGMMLTVEKQGSPGAMAFIMPFRPKPGVQAASISQHFADFVAESEPRFKARITEESAADRSVSHFTSVAAEQPVEGRFSTILAANGTMAFVIGVSAPQGQLDAEMFTLKKIAQSFGFLPPLGRWIDYQSPAGGFAMKIPQGWQVESSDGRTHKDDIDWVVFDRNKPLSRVFQWCPRFCSPQLLQDPLHAIRGYQAAQFRNHEHVVTSSLGQISQNVKLLMMNVNQPLTRVFREMNQQVSQLLASLAAAQSDIVVYDCLAQAQLDGKLVTVAFVAGIQTTAINAGISGQLIDWRVTLRGWCAEPGQFVSDSPVLERICSSMQLSHAFLRNIMNGNEQATARIRETYAYMNKIDDQIRQSRWDTMSAIAEMNYDNLREAGGYVNEKTGRIEQISPEKVVKNSRGEYVSREEVERGVHPNNATVLRDAHTNDYMRGVYGRIEF